MDNFRFILVLALSALLFMLWQAWQVDYGPKPEITTARPTTPTKTDIPLAGSNKEDLPDASISSEEDQQPKVSQKPKDDSKVIVVETDVYRLEINTRGGTLQNLDLLQYPVEKGGSEVIRLFDTDNIKQFLGQSGLLTSQSEGVDLTHHSLLSAESYQYILEPGQDTLKVPLTISSNGLTVTKTYIFKRGSYQVDMEQSVDNQTGKTWRGRQYTQLLRNAITEDNGNTFIRTYLGGVVYTEEEKYEKISFDDMADESLNRQAVGGWSAMIQHYFAAAWVPPADKTNLFYTKQLNAREYVIGSYSEQVSIANNQQGVLSSTLFVGPKLQPVMEKIATGLELTVDYSWLTFIGKPIFWLLNKLHGFFQNWGVAIIFVTLIIKTLFFKLSEASYRSMAKMRKIQPRLAQLRERFGDDRQRFNQEMMAMYKKEKVNPMGGCFPILVQIPVFISLYWVLIETVELRQAPFALWIQDLSAKDPYFVLPVLMGISMFIQQRLNPTPVDPMQAMVIKFFPLIFTIFFLMFPSGLVLYWVVNNTLSILQQWYITKSIDADDKKAVAN